MRWDARQGYFRPVAISSTRGKKGEYAERQMYH